MARTLESLDTLRERERERANI